MALQFPAIIKITFMNVIMFYYEHLIPFFVVFYIKMIYFPKENSLGILEH